MFDCDGYGYIDADEIQDLLESAEEDLSHQEQNEIINKAGNIVDGKLNYERNILNNFI